MKQLIAVLLFAFVALALNGCKKESSTGSTTTTYTATSRLDVTEEQAVRTQIELARSEGIAAGISSGAALYAALSIAQRSGMTGKRIVVESPLAEDFTAALRRLGL